jgi:hypothetical protein
MKPYFTVKASKWNRMPAKTKLALLEMAKCVLKQYGGKAKPKKKR